MSLLIATLLSVLALGHCGLYTVTDEAWFDVKVVDMDGTGEDYTGRFVIALFGDTAPMTVMNFAAIAKGYTRGNQTLHYKDTFVHRIVPDFTLQMGDVTAGDGSGGKSIFGEQFNDEDFLLSHRSSGWVSMANHGKDTNGSQFFVILNKARWLDTKHVVFGKVIRGFNVIETLGEVPSDVNTAIPKRNVKIVDSGINYLERKYDLREDQLDSTDDM